MNELHHQPADHTTLPAQLAADAASKTTEMSTNTDILPINRADAVVDMQAADATNLSTQHSNELTPVAPMPKVDPSATLSSSAEQQDRSNVIEPVTDETKGESTGNHDNYILIPLARADQKRYDGTSLGSDTEWPDPTLSPEEHQARVEAGLTRSREILGHENWSNSKHAGEVYFDDLPDELKEKFPNGVQFSYEGFPIFDPVAEKEVVFEAGFGPNRLGDFKDADAACGFEKPQADRTWHHKEDGKTLLLVDKELHRDVKHWGGVSIKNRLDRREADSQ